MADGNNNSNDIKNWLKINILDFADSNEVENLIVELKFLVDILPEQYRLELHSEYHVLSEWIKTVEVDISLTETNELQIYENGIDHKIFLKNIRERHLHLKELYLITFLVHRADSSKVNAIRALYFFLSLKMVELTDYDSRIETTLDECRFLTNKTREFSIQFLPDVNEYSSMQDLLSAFESIQSENLYEEWLKSDDKELEGFVENYIKMKRIKSGLIMSSLIIDYLSISMNLFYHSKIYYSKNQALLGTSLGRESLLSYHLIFLLMK